MERVLKVGPGSQLWGVNSYSSHRGCHYTAAAAKSLLFENSLGDVVIVSLSLEVDNSTR